MVAGLAAVGVGSGTREDGTAVAVLEATAAEAGACVDWVVTVGLAVA